MRASTLLVLGASTVNAASIGLNTRTLCIFPLPFLSSHCSDSSTSPDVSTTTTKATGPCVDGSDADSFYTSWKGDVYAVCDDTDRPGNTDIKSVSSTSYQACADLCSRTSGCVAIDFSSATCWLKSSVPAPYTYNGGRSLVKTTTGNKPDPLAAAAVPASTPTKGTGPCVNGAQADSIYTSWKGDVFAVCDNTNRPSNSDFKITQSTTFQACADLCSRTSGCVAMDFSSSTCYLKNTVPAPQTSSGVRSCVKTSSGNNPDPMAAAAAPSSTPTKGTGPCVNGAKADMTYTSWKGDVYAVCHNTDRQGSDIKNVPSANFQNCADTCSRTSGCVGIEYHDSTCWLKSTVLGPTTLTNGESLIKISSGNNPDPSSTTSSTPAATPTKGTGPCVNNAAANYFYTTWKGDVFAVCSGSNRPGSDIKTISSSNAQDCSDACSRTSGCVAGVYGNSQCWMKNASPDAVTDGKYDSIVRVAVGNRPDPLATTSTTTTTTKAAPTTTTTTTTTTPRTTSTTTKSAAPLSTSCGVAGYDKGTPAASRSDSSGTYNTFASCKAFCKNSLSFAVGGGSCLCYDAPTANNINVSPSSPYLFYDAGCAAPAVQTTTPKPTLTTSGCAATATVTVTATLTVRVE